MRQLYYKPLTLDELTVDVLGPLHSLQSSIISELAELREDPGVAEELNEVRELSVPVAETTDGG